MLFFSVAVSIGLTLLPVFLVLVARSTVERQAWEIALDIPCVVSADLLTVLLLARFFTLETSILISRACWIVFASVWTAQRLRRKKAPRWPRAMGFREVLAVATSAGLAAFISMRISRPYRIGDHNWHDGLATAIAGQKLPFMNVYDWKAPLHYHFAGDVFAGILRTLSFDVMTSALALALDHDVSFALTATVIGLLMIGAGQRGFWPAALGGVLFLLHGPIPLRGGLGGTFNGYAYYNFLEASCRPHTSLAGLLMVGFVGAVASRLTIPGARRLSGLAALFATGGALGVADEASISVLGVGLGAAWLVCPRFLARTRLRGLALLAALAATIFGLNILFGGSFAQGGPVNSVVLVPARIPALWPPMPALKTSAGQRILLCETLPFVVGLMAIVATRSAPSRRAFAALVVFSGTVVALAVWAALRLEINHSASECQRFFVAPYFATCTICLWQLPRMNQWSLAVVATIFCLGAPALFTVHWLSEQAKNDLRGDRAISSPYLTEDLYDFDCRRNAGAHLGERPQVRYLETSHVFFQYISCHPVFTPGHVMPPWTVKIAPLADSSLEQLRQLHADYLAPDETLEAICPADGEASDPVCARALRARSGCRREGLRFLSCPLAPSDRAALLR
ncbi:MAG: hypothetical protein M3O36_01340 [Myxococcota bacterium]|nr:hypothetical protein [Myxococcota bacterium]